MKLAELMDENPRGIFEGDVILKGEIIALDAKDGKKLFDTRVNKREYVNKFMNAEIINLWSDVRLIKSVFGDFFRPVMKCYLSHNSWKESELEELKHSFKNDGNIHEAIAVSISIKRINQHLAEIEE